MEVDVSGAVVDIVVDGMIVFRVAVWDGTGSVLIEVENYSWSRTICLWL